MVQKVAKTNARGLYRAAQYAHGAACGCVTNAGYKIDIFYKFIPEVTGVSTRRAADPMLTRVRNRGRVNPVAPDILLKF